MTWEKLGLKCGIELHQQFEGHKLFCRCPTILRDDKPTTIIERRLRPVASELGKFDPSAIQEYVKGRKYVYQGYDTTCEVEADASPPIGPNPEMITTALEVGKMMHVKTVDEIRFMRKTVIDGSNTSGFQRTAMLSTGGYLNTSKGKVHLDFITIEEDAARKIESDSKQIIYRLDRLGIPLLEIVTSPDIKTPEHAKETALLIGEICRRTCKAKRGQGTVRQDVNVSIKEGTRCELKGVSDITIVDQYVAKEAERQQHLVKIMKELKKRKLDHKDLIKNHYDVSETFKNSDSKIIQNGLKGKGKVYALKVPGFNGLIGGDKDKPRLGRELAQYAKIKAGVKGIFHSDEMPNYGITTEDIRKIKLQLKNKEKDAFILVVAPHEQAMNALQAVYTRLQQSFHGVITETRNPLDDGTSEYMRPLGTGARMYPETDVPVTLITQKMLDNVEVPLTTEKRVKLYMKHGLSKDQAESLKLSNWSCTFESWLDKKLDGKIAANILLNTLTSLRREGFPTDNISSSRIEEVIKQVQDGKISKDVIQDILGQLAENPNANLEDLKKQLGFESTDSSEVEAMVKKVVAANKDLVKEQGMRAAGPLMGDVMKHLRGKADGKTISILLKKEIEKITS